MMARWLSLLTLCALSAPAHADDRAVWLKEARFGVMSHYLAEWIAKRDNLPEPSVAQWNELVDHFDVETLANQLAQVHAGYYLLTIGQGSGFYVAPNATYDRLTGVTPSRLSRRDLVSDLSAELAKRNIKLMVYLGTPGADPAVAKKLGLVRGPYRNREYQLRWEQVIREWSLRWGKKIAGWWFDGAYWPNAMYRSAEPPNFASCAAAARAGNPESAVAFNGGVADRLLSLTPFEDYTAGEIEQPDRLLVRRLVDGKVDGAVPHALSYLGQTWGTGGPRFSIEQAVELSRKVSEQGAALTWDAPLERNGTFSRPFIEQLAAVGRALRRNEAPSAAGEHAVIGVGTPEDTTHTQHPGAQWFPEAGLGLFIHWSIASVKAMNISWPMFDRGTGSQITPNDYWAQAKDFNPKKYDPDKWLKAAHKAGFTYAVLTTRHHDGFAMWPTRFGDFNTKSFLGGADLVKPFIEACRRNGLKVGLYYSGPDWYFDRDFMSFTRKPGAPPRGPDGKDRTGSKTPEEEARHRAEYAALVRGQVEELLTQYGKIDLLWFDGKPRGLTGDDCITLARIRELQPGIVVNPRLHNRGDYRTYERQLRAETPATGWAEFCNTWTDYWPHVANAPFRAPGFVLGQYVTARSLRVNYLLGVGPTSDGEFVDDIYANLAAVAEWRKANARSVEGTQPLPAGESATVPATSAGTTRYLFALPAFKEGGRFEKDLLPASDGKVTLKGVPKPLSVKLLRDGSPLKSTYADGAVTVDLPASKRSKTVDVLKIELPRAGR
jgi:alpha-L-fucosidase